MEIIKVLLIGVLGSITVITLRVAKPEFAVAAALATGLVVAVYALSYLSDAVGIFSELASLAGLSDGLFSGVLKIIGIGYLTEYSSAICAEAGSELIAKKVSMAGKIAIFLMSVEVIRALSEVLRELIELQSSL